MKLSDEVYRQARALIVSRLGLDFPETRQADLERGLVRACRTSSVSAPETYLTWLASLPGESPEWKRLAGHLTVGETYFFRDRAAFEALEQQVLPPLIAARRAQGLLRLRLWSAGCATGEEPYSLAILLDRLLPDRADWALTILATDINPEALEAARQACYRRWAFRETPAWIRDRYFHRRAAEAFELDAAFRGMVTFAPLNLAADGYPSAVTNTNAMDLILCRNVLMYFTRETQRATVARLQRALVSGGWLVVSPAEASAELFSPLAPMNFPGAILYRNASPARGIGTRLSPERWNDKPVQAPPPGAGEDSGGGSAPDLPPIPTFPRVGGKGNSPFPKSFQLNLAPMPARGEGRAPQEARTEIPPDTPTELRRARALADQGHLEQARHLCEAALAQDRLDPEVYLLLATICQEQGESQEAVEALRRAIYLAPDSAAAHFLLGNVLLRQGQRRRARHCMEIVVHLLQEVPRDEAVRGGDGLTAGWLLEVARAYLESQS